MIVPQYWAEGRIQHKKDGKQVTVRRFGWADGSQEVAGEARAPARKARVDRPLRGGFRSIFLMRLCGNKRQRLGRSRRRPGDGVARRTLPRRVRAPDCLGERRQQHPQP